ncbi:coat protein [Fusarium pseudograminearum megabirnavirus 1]|uniref:Coat protein n=1 Tax=Fusarium pseudograminearum megabirnavirus 1 TaxID=2478384 RepID=A0A499S185_9VIRU|nr:coat protein [Fusarium pseudograminearum megabirnavirus 1]
MQFGDSQKVELAREAVFMPGSKGHKYEEVNDVEALRRLFSALGDFSNADMLGKMNVSAALERSLRNHQAIMQGEHKLSVQAVFSHFAANDVNGIIDTRPVLPLAEVSDQKKLRGHIEATLASVLRTMPQANKDIWLDSVTGVLNGYDDAGSDGHVHNIARLVAGFMAATAGALQAGGAGRSGASFLPGSDILPTFGAGLANDWSLEALGQAIQPDYDSRVGASIVMAKTMPALNRNQQVGAVIVLSNFWRQNCGFNDNYFNSGRPCTYVEPFSEVGRVSCLITTEAARDGWMPRVAAAGGVPQHHGAHPYVGALMEDPNSWMGAIATYCGLTDSAKHLTAAANLVLQLQGRFPELPLTSASIPLDDTFRDLNLGDEASGRVDEDGNAIRQPVTLESMACRRLVHMWTAEIKYRNSADNADLPIAHAQWPAHPYVGWKFNTAAAATAAGPDTLANNLADEVFPAGHTANNTRRTYHNKGFARNTAAAAEAGAQPDTTRTPWDALRGLTADVPAADALNALEIDQYWYDFFLNERVVDRAGMRRALASMTLAQRFDMLAWLADINVAGTTWAARWTDHADLGVTSFELRNLDLAGGRSAYNDIRRMLHLNPRFIGGTTHLAGVVPLESWCGIKRARQFILGGGNQAMADAESSRLVRLLCTTNHGNLAAALTGHMLVMRGCADVAAAMAGLTEAAQLAVVGNVVTSCAPYNEIADLVNSRWEQHTPTGLQDDYQAYLGTMLARAGIYDVLPALQQEGTCLSFSERIYMAPTSAENMMAEVVQRALHPSYLEVVLPGVFIGGGLPSFKGMSDMFGEDHKSVLSRMKLGKGLTILEMAGYLEVLAALGGLHYDNLVLRTTLTLPDEADPWQCDFAKELLSFAARKSDLVPASVMGAVPNAWLLSFRAVGVRALELQTRPCLVPVRDQNEVAFCGPQYRRTVWSPIYQADRARLPLSRYWATKKVGRECGYTFAIRQILTTAADSLMEGNMRKVKDAGAWQTLQMQTVTVGKVRGNNDAISDVRSVAQELGVGQVWTENAFNAARKAWRDEIVNPSGSFGRRSMQTFSGLQLDTPVPQNTVRSRTLRTAGTMYHLSSIAFECVRELLQARAHVLRFKMQHMVTLLPGQSLELKEQVARGAAENTGTKSIDEEGTMSALSGVEGVADVLGTSTFTAQVRARLPDLLQRSIVVKPQGLADVSDSPAVAEVADAAEQSKN